MSTQTEATHASDDTEAQDTARVPARIREINGIAGHGVARAYGYITLAAAFGAEAELVDGSTRSGKAGLRIAVHEPQHGGEQVLDQVDDLYARLIAEAEKTAAEQRAAARHDENLRQHIAGYETNRFTRAVIAGFLQGAARVLKTEQAIRPAPYKNASRARVIDEHAHRIGLRAGAAYARSSIIAEQEHAAAG